MTNSSNLDTAPLQHKTSKKILLLLESAPCQLSEEAVLAVFALASFEHEIVIALAKDAVTLLQEKGHKLYKMLGSIDLYDIPSILLFGDDTYSHKEETFEFTQIASKKTESYIKSQDFDAVWRV